ncbi:MAG: glutamyl-tRNA reductase [Bacteroidota bacterium]
MLQDYKILTVTHRNTKLNAIGQFALTFDNQPVVTSLRRMKEVFGLSELFYVATCNRVLFLFINQEACNSGFVERFFQHVNPTIDHQLIHDNVLTFTGEEAVRHLYEVGASVDSLVVGERQILGQLREAFEQATKDGLIGHYLRLLLQRMIVAGKDVYANTRIGEKSLSVVALAVRKLLNCKLPTDARILLIGAGQTNTLISKFLTKYEYRNVVVFNRSIGKAELLAKKFKQEAYPLTALPAYQGGFDCIIVCTGASEPILTAPLYQQLLQGEAAEEKIIVDLAIPHNTHPALLEAYPSTYIEIEGLRSLADENRAFRERELTVAKKLLVVHIEEFATLLQQRQLELAMRQIPVEIKAVRQKAVNEVYHKEIEQLDDSARAVLDEVLRYMEKKCIGIPMRVARETLLP